MTEKEEIMIKKIIDVLCFVIGPVLLVFPLYSLFQSWRYDEGKFILLMFGVALICFGFLWRRWAKEEKGNDEKD